MYLRKQLGRRKAHPASQTFPQLAQQPRVLDDVPAATCEGNSNQKNGGQQITRARAC